MNKPLKKAVILFSGGLDSTTCLAIAESEGYLCHALSFDYGQRHSIELETAKRIATTLGITHHIVPLPLTQIGGSALTDNTIDVPDYTGDPTIPVTYVPARNTIFLSFALAFAEVLHAQTIFIGASSIDYSHYPDCRPEYFEAFQTMASLSTKASVESQSVRIKTPLLHLSKAETIQKGHELGVNYKDTVSCYQANQNGEACGRCDSCILRKKGFKDAHLPDETRYIEP
ncbi:MAG: 7-cyano-7-deazaguanine synthase QueC [Gammaproteobacteria bacterium]|nr:7-cyano-7-deazaguanine synthase QueC [Gammaproteobacteria bacterium]